MSKNVHSCFFHHCKQIWIVRCPFHIPDIFPFKTNQFAFFPTFFQKKEETFCYFQGCWEKNIFFSSALFKSYLQIEFEILQVHLRGYRPNLGIAGGQWHQWLISTWKGDFFFFVKKKDLSSFITFYVINQSAPLGNAEWIVEVFVGLDTESSYLLWANRQIVKGMNSKPSFFFSRKPLIILYNGSLACYTGISFT